VTVPFPALGDSPYELRRESLDLFEAFGMAIQNLDGLFAECVDDTLRKNRTDTFYLRRGQKTPDALQRGRLRRFAEFEGELTAVLTVIDPVPPEENRLPASNLRALVSRRYIRFPRSGM